MYTQFGTDLGGVGWWMESISYMHSPLLSALRRPPLLSYSGVRPKDAKQVCSFNS